MRDPSPASKRLNNEWRSDVCLSAICRCYFAPHFGKDSNKKQRFGGSGRAIMFVLAILGLVMACGNAAAFSLTREPLSRTSFR